MEQAKTIIIRRRWGRRTVLRKCVLLGALGSAAQVAMGMVPASLDPMQDELSGRLLLVAGALVAGSLLGALAAGAARLIPRPRHTRSKIQTWKRRLVRPEWRRLAA